MVSETSPAINAAAVTPSDSVSIAGGPCRGLYVGTTGNVAVVMPDGTTTVTFVAVPAGTILPVCARRVNSTNTTASNIVALL